MFVFHDYVFNQLFLRPIPPGTKLDWTFGMNTLEKHRVAEHHSKSMLWSEGTKVAQIKQLTELINVGNLTFITNLYNVNKLH